MGNYTHLYDGNLIPVLITSRKRIFSYPYPGEKHNQQLVSIPTYTKSMPHAKVSLEQRVIYVKQNR